MSTPAEHPGIPWQRLRAGALLAGLGGLALCVLAYVLGVSSSDPEQWLTRRVFFAYLFAYNVYLGLGLGSLGIWMLHNLTGGAWGAVIRRSLEAGTRTLPLLAILFVPVVAGIPYLYLWAAPGALPPGSELYRLLQHKQAYLNVPFFLVRAVVYFVIWLGVSWLLNRWAAQVDERPDPVIAGRAAAFSGRALVLYFLAITFAAVDWLMSLEPTWYSTIFGVLVAVGQIVPGMALAIAAAVWLASRSSWGRGVAPEVWNDLGNLLLASVMLWAYISFAQLLLVWSGNLPEEITWYVKRSEGGWEYVGAVLALFYFALPFLLLLSRGNKRSPSRLLAIALLLLAMSVVHQFWLVTPACSPGALTVHWVDAAAVVGLGGLWLAVFVWQLGARPLTPPVDPLLQGGA